jgi:hypothetical protein
MRVRQPHRRIVTSEPDALRNRHALSAAPADLIRQRLAAYLLEVAVARCVPELRARLVSEKPAGILSSSMSTWRRAFVGRADLAAVVLPSDWSPVGELHVDVSSLDTIGEWFTTVDHTLLTRRSGEGWQATYRHAQTGFLARRPVYAETELDAAHAAVAEYLTSLPDYRTVIPPDWIDDPDDAVLARCFRILRTNEGESEPTPQPLIAGDVCAAVYFGPQSYVLFEPIRPVITPAPGEPPEIPLVTFHPPARLTSRTTEVAWHLLLFAHAPLDVAGAIFEARERITACSALLRTFEPGLLFHFEWENLLLGVSRRRGGVSAPTSILSADEPDLSLARVGEMQGSYDALAGLDDAERARINLALSWFDGAVVSSAEGREEPFLRMWFALEALAMPNTTNVRPVNELLAQAYQMTLEAATEQFFIGRLAGLRSRIVHGDARISNPAPLTDYLIAVFTDVFRQMLGLACERRAIVALADSELEQAVRLAVRA